MRRWGACCRGGAYAAGRTASSLIWIRDSKRAATTKHKDNFAQHIYNLDFAYCWGWLMKRCWLISILIKLMQNEDADNKYKANLSEEDSAQQRNSKESHWPSHDIPARGISTRATIATHLPGCLITFRYFWLVLEVDSSTFPRFFSFFS